MSYSDIEEYNFLSQKDRSPNCAKQRMPSRKHLRKNYYVTKTLYDPMDTISKRSRRNLMADRSDGFCMDVPYSMNKQERWEKIDAATLLKIRQEEPAETLETLIVNRVDVPPPDAEQKNTVESIKIVQNDGIVTLASGKRSNSLSHFNSRIRGLKHMDKKEPDPARLLFNFSVVDQSPAKRTKKKCNQRKRRTYKNSLDTDYEDCETSKTLGCELYASIEELAVNEQESSFYDRNSTKFSDSSLGSFSDLGLDECSIVTKQEIELPTKISTSSSSVAKVSQKIPSKKKTAVNASTTAGTIFEVIETPLECFEPFSIEENILPYVRKGLLKKWLDPNRLFVSSLEISHPKFVMFFEEERSKNILRVRISADTSYTTKSSRKSLIDIVTTKEKRNLFELPNNLYDFIIEPALNWSEEYRNNYDWNCRTFRYAEGYRCRVNSKLIAPMAVSSFEFEQMNQLRQIYERERPNMDSPTDPDSKNNLRCYCCRKKGKTDCFWLSTGMMCRECVSISIIDQLKRKNFPIEIPKISPSSSLHFEVLFAILPIPTVCSLLKEWLAFQAKPRYEMRFLTCPNCMKPHEFCPMPLATTENCVFDSCSCTKCLNAFCYLCEWESHWPMSCEQFKRWTSRWDTQYIYENHHIDGEQLRLCCACEEFYSVPNGAEDKSCPRFICSLCYRSPFLGLHEHSNDSKYNWKNLDIKLLRHLSALGINIKKCKICGHEILPESVEIRPVMNSKTAELCAYARRQRFLQNSDFEKYVMITFNAKKKEKFKDLRITVLYLIEFCTGWIYVAKPFDWRHLRLQISNLNNSLQLIEQRIPSARDDFIKQMGELEEETKNLIELVQKSLRKR